MPLIKLGCMTPDEIRIAATADRALAFAARGLLIGLAMTVLLVVAVEAADAMSSGDDGDTPLAAAAALLLTALVGVLAGPLVGALLAWALRLPRPWLVSLAGTAAGVLLLCAGAGFGMTAAEPYWLLPGFLLAVAYAGAAALSALGGRSGDATSGTVEATTTHL
ncbi:hypothetical protein Cci01nite_14110 [Catellatospora citrea]|uniref:Uncharacterized protein n=2 Tax=Catellatospora citrea TaxID=53366 RepID=A0A8J3K4F7_9ACTN|nr:hypothetical protein C8E86_7393 [Catellatospora citrea]GIF96317.1 hypothetical protein Cci01nite_14110 [Catellatospora citrea]